MMNTQRRSASWLLVCLFFCITLGATCPNWAAKSDAKATPYRPKLKVKGDLVRHPIWGVELRIPGFKKWKDNPHLAQPNNVLAAHSRTSCNLNLTMWVENVPDGATAEECRRGYAGNPEVLKEKESVRFHESQTAPITYSLFDYELGQSGSGGILNNQLYGYWTRGDHCFELHISSMACKQFAQIAKPILESVKLSEDTGATLLTVAVALEDGGDPRDWSLHAAVAGIILHQSDPPHPQSARRFYSSALRLGGDDIGAKDLWLIEEGLGLSWLMQDDGAPGIPHLVRALETAKGSSELAGVVSESAYNLACALSLAGNIDAACALTRELLESLDSEARAGKIEEMEADTQLRSLRESPCYLALQAELRQR